MKGNGNNWSTLIQKLYFMLIPSSGKRTKYIIKHSYLFKHVGGGYFLAAKDNSYRSGTYFNRNKCKNSFWC